MVRARLKPSRLLSTIFTLAHCAAGATVFPLDVSVELKTALLAVILVSLAHSIHRDALLRSRHSIVELELYDKERAAIKLAGSDWQDARILSTSCVTPSLTVLNLRIERGRVARHVLLVRDNMNAEDFRRIRVRLRWARPKADKPESDPGEAGV